MPILYERSIFLTVTTEDMLRMAGVDRVGLSKLAGNIHRIVLRYGFMQVPDVPVALRLCDVLGLEIDPDSVAYFVGLGDFKPDGRGVLLKLL